MRRSSEIRRTIIPGISHGSNCSKLREDDQPSVFICSINDRPGQPRRSRSAKDRTCASIPLLRASVHSVCVPAGKRRHPVRWQRGETCWRRQSRRAGAWCPPAATILPTLPGQPPRGQHGREVARPSAADPRRRREWRPEGILARMGPAGNWRAIWQNALAQFTGLLPLHWNCRAHRQHRHYPPDCHHGLLLPEHLSELQGRPDRATHACAQPHQ